MHSTYGMDEGTGHHLANGVNGSGYEVTGGIDSVNNALTGEQSVMVPVGNQASHGVNGQASNASVGGANKQFVPIAICGMACRLPGKIHRPEALWHFLAEGRDARSTIPENRWSATAYYSPVKKKGTSPAKHGYFLDESIDLGALDTDAFPLSRGEVERMDPQQRLLLEVAHECMDDSGEPDWQGSNTGCYVGSFGQDWYDVQNRDALKYSNNQMIGSHDFAISERISHELGFHGPSLTIRTACSSSMIALNEACMALAKGDCKGAIIGGTSIFLSPNTLQSLAETGVLSPDGSSNTFSSNVNGYARGEGIVALYVKTLADAVRDGNPIRAVVPGVSTNFDGKTSTMGRPSAPGQEAAIRRAYEVAGITNDIWKTAYFEAHGTGTKAGDQTETRAIAAVFGGRGIHVSSLKANLGHSEGAAGLSAILKAILVLEHRTIPPSIKAWPLNPAIPWKSAKLQVASECISWPAERAERVSINSFGIGGANGHAIVDSASSWGISPRCNKEGPAPDEPHLFTFSAYSVKSLERVSQNLKSFLEMTAECFADVAYTLGRRRQHLPHRSFFVASRNQPEIASNPIGQDLGRSHTVVMVFTGQGAQWPQMGRGLLQSNRAFSETISVIDKRLQQLGAEWSIKDELRKTTRSSRIHDPEFAQPLCTAIQIALVETLAHIGIKPAAVVGHSSGEIAAAYAAGALTLDEAVAVAFHRGKVSKTQTKRGAMAAVALSWSEAHKHLIPGVVVGCENSHNSVTLSGDADAIVDVVTSIREAYPGIATTILKVGRAYHSHHMKELGDAYYKALVSSGVAGTQPSIPFFSSVTGDQLATTGKQGRLGANYFMENMVSPVRFKPAVVKILCHMDIVNPVFLEVGPHPALEGPIRQITTSEKRKMPHVSTLTRRQDGRESLLITVGRLWALRVKLDLAAVIRDGRTLANLPSYPWAHEKSHWYEPRVARDWRLCRSPYHDLLGRRIPESTDLEPIWRNLLHLENVPWVSDHRIDGDIIFPFAGYLAMAAEAIQQVTESHSETIEARNVTVATALLISEDSPKELVTTLCRSRLTDSLDSDWHKFTVSSYNGHGWTKNCTGEIRRDPTDSQAETQMSNDWAYPRKVNCQLWYETLRRKGVRYGPHFMGLEEISSSAALPTKASAKLRDDWHGDEINYFLHPVIFEAFFQLLSVAAHRGLPHTYRRQVPIRVDHLTISRCRSNNLGLSIEGEQTYDGGALGQGHLFDGSRVISKVSGLRMSLFEGVDPAVKIDFPLTARAEWVLHVGSRDTIRRVQKSDADLKHLELLEDLVRHAIWYLQQLSLDHKPRVAHMQKYVSWLEVQETMASSGRHNPNALEALGQSLKLSPLRHVARAVERICDNAKLILNGEKDPNDVLADGNLLEKLTELASGCYESEFFKALGRFKPNLRILQLVSGSAVAVKNIIQCLRHPKGQDLFSKYVIANVTTDLVNAAKSELKDIPNLEFVRMTAEKDLESQNFGGGDFDLVITPRNLSKELDVAKFLSQIRALMSPRGTLVVHEPLSRQLWTDLTLGVLPSWWSSQAGHFSDQVPMSREDWTQQLSSSGFDTPDFMQEATGVTLMRSKVLTSQPTPEQNTTKKLTLLYDNVTPEIKKIFQEFEARGYTIAKCTIKDKPQRGQDVLVVLDLEYPFLWELEDGRLQYLQSFVKSLEGSRVLWATQPSQTGVKDPRFAPVIGFSRTMRSESAAMFATCEMDEVTATSISTLADVFSEFQSRDSDEVLGPDFEYAILDGSIFVNRIFPFKIDDEVIGSVEASEAALEIGKAGQLSSLRWTAQEAVRPQENEVDVEVYATGLNFRDVLVAAGIVPLPETQFGYEAAGLVRKIGPKVTKVQPGDRVLLMGRKTFATHVVQSELLCEKIPDSLSFLDAASSPLCFTTAIYGLLDIGRLEAGQSVLIHSAAGGVGIAAIQVAKFVEAEIYATAGTPEKRRFLTEQFGIPATRVFDSRSTAFAGEILRETDGRGVDVALNSLSGEMLHKTWDCIAKWGSMVEIGKRDLLGSAKLDMKPFSDNRSYCCVDMEQMTRERPRLVNRLLQRMVDYLQQGILRPIPLARISPAAEISETFRFMQQGKHFGKIVVELRNDKTGLLTGDIQPLRKRPVQMDSSAAYLLIGGLGGLGRSISRYLIQQGARNLIFLSRSADRHDPRYSDFVLEMESMGAKVQCVQGNAAREADVEKAIDGAQAPVRGIFNLTMVLADENFQQMTIEQWDTAINPKVQGTCNILKVSKSRRLEIDFVILLSSFSAAVGRAGLANYASANTFLDAFSQYSSRQGVPCTTIAPGPIENVGVMVGNVEFERGLQAAGWRLNRESEFLDAMDAAIQRMLLSKSEKPLNACATATIPPQSDGNTAEDRSRFIFGLCPPVPLNSPDNHTSLRSDARMAVYHNTHHPNTTTSSSSSSSSSSGDALHMLLTSAKKDPAVLSTEESTTVLASVIGRRLRTLLLLPADTLLSPGTPLVELGLDSMVAVEMGSWWKMTFGLELGIMDVMSVSTLGALAERAAVGLTQLYSS